MVQRRQSDQAITPGGFGLGSFTDPENRELRKASPLRRLSIFLVCQVLLATGVSFAAGQDVPVLEDGGHFDCLPIAGFGLRGVRLWEPEDEAKGKLGAPLRRSEGGGEDEQCEVSRRLPHLIAW